MHKAGKQMPTPNRGKQRNAEQQLSSSYTSLNHAKPQG